MTLAGSISFGHYYFIAVGEYDSTSLGEYSYNIYSEGMNLLKQSDTEVSMDCYTEWGETKTSIEIKIPNIPLDGEHDNVIFDYTSKNASVFFDNTEYNPVDVSIKGWIRNKQFKPKITRGEPVTQTYLLEIEIDCVLDDKPLHLTLTSPEL
jgi:hypothetical protein